MMDAPLKMFRVAAGPSILSVGPPHSPAPPPVNEKAIRHGFDMPTKPPSFSRVSAHRNAPTSGLS